MRLNLFKYSIFLVGLLQAHIFFGETSEGLLSNGSISATQAGFRVGPEFRELFRKYVPSKRFNCMPRIEDYVLQSMGTFPMAQQLAMTHLGEDCTAYKVENNEFMRLDEVEEAVDLVLRSKNLNSLCDSEFVKIANYLSVLLAGAYEKRPETSYIAKLNMKKNEKVLNDKLMRAFCETYNKASKMRKPTIMGKIEELTVIKQEHARSQRKYFEANRRNGTDASPRYINCELKEAEAIEEINTKIRAYEKVLENKKQR